MGALCICEDWSDWILVAEFDHKIAGHSVLEKDPEKDRMRIRCGVAYCDLLVVDPDFAAAV